MELSEQVEQQDSLRDKCNKTTLLKSNVLCCIVPYVDNTDGMSRQLNAGRVLFTALQSMNEDLYQ